MPTKATGDSDDAVTRFRCPSLDAELPQMVIRVAVTEHAPRVAAEFPERGMLRPLFLGGTRADVAQEACELGAALVQRAGVRVAAAELGERGRSFRERHQVDEELAERGVAEDHLLRL